MNAKEGAGGNLKQSTCDSQSCSGHAAKYLKNQPAVALMHRRVQWTDNKNLRRKLQLKHNQPARLSCQFCPMPSTGWMFLPRRRQKEEPESLLSPQHRHLERIISIVAKSCVVIIICRWSSFYYSTGWYDSRSRSKKVGRPHLLWVFELRCTPVGPICGSGSPEFSHSVLAHHLIITPYKFWSE